MPSVLEVDSSQSGVYIKNVIYIFINKKKNGSDCCQNGKAFRHINQSKDRQIFYYFNKP